MLNYRAALNEAIRLLNELPLSQRLIRGAHKVLMQGVRGHNKSPGEYRRLPNWFGPKGCTIEQARFVPCGADRLPQAMDEWERYLHAAAPDRLVQLAIAHAEFEAVHPFLDGNGRLGRLLVPLFLFSQGLLSRPNFYLSAEIVLMPSSAGISYPHLSRLHEMASAGGRASRAKMTDKEWSRHCRHTARSPSSTGRGGYPELSLELTV